MEDAFFGSVTRMESLCNKQDLAVLAEIGSIKSNKVYRIQKNN